MASSSHLLFECLDSLLFLFFFPIFYRKFVNLNYVVRYSSTVTCKTESELYLPMSQFQWSLGKLV